jgi:hypothetical protein
MTTIIKNHHGKKTISIFRYGQQKMTKFSYTDLEQRLLILMSGRNKHPWGEALGMNSSMITRMFRGQFPGHEYLAVIARAERVSLNWLLTGFGAPYEVMHAHSDGEVAYQADLFLSDAPLSWTVYLIVDGELSALAFHRPDQVFIETKTKDRTEEKVIDYDRIELIAGPVGQQTLDALRRASILQIREVKALAETMIRLFSGEIGTYAMVKEDGLFERYELLNLRNGPEIREKAGNYTLEPDERILLEKYRRLKPADKTRLIAIGGALGEVERQELEDL